MKQKILHILSGDVWGGAEAQVLTQVSELRRLGLEVEVVLFNSGFAFKQFKAADIPSHFIEEGSSPLSFLKHGLELVIAQEPSLLVSHGYKEGLLAWRASKHLKAPWVATFHGLTEAYRGWKSAKMAAYQAVYRYLVRSSARHIVCVSQDLAQALGFAELEKLRVIYNASSASAGEHEAPAVLTEKPSILMLGRLVSVKRVDVAITAFELLLADATVGEPPHLYIAGDGPQRAALEARVPAAIKQNVHFLGFHTEPLQLLAEANVYFLSSDSEGLPSSLLDAIALGVPAVCTAVGGIPEVQSLMPGYPLHLAPAGDAAALHLGLQLALADDISPEQKLGFAKEFSAHFSPRVIAEQHSALYESILKPRELA